MSSRQKFARVGVAIVATVLLFTATSAQAAIQNLEFVNTGGTVTIGALPPLTLPVPGGGIAGEWDDVSGDFEGVTTFNPINIPANPPTVPVDVVVNLNADGDPNVTGTIDPTTGDASLTAEMVLVIEIPSLSITCTSPGFDVEFSTEGGSAFEPLPFDDTSTYTIGLEGVFTIPEFPSTACGTGNEGIVPVLNMTLGTPAEGGITLPLERGTVPPPPPTTSTTAAPTTSTTAASQPATQPRFTG
jgi:hypothetical protein